MYVVKRHKAFLLDNGCFGFPNVIDAIAGFDDKEEAADAAWSLGHEATVMEVSPYQLRLLNEAA